MAKEIAIALNFTSKGETKVIKNLQDLEKELAVLQQDLKTLDFGSDAFNQAAANINRLKSQIKDVDKATEGLETAQRIQAIGEAVGIAVSSFQILSGVIGLFITDQEDLEAVQRAETTALQVLNVALGINTLLFQSAELSAKGYTLSTIASEIATKTAAKATALWNKILALNPLVLVTAGVAALAAGIYFLIEAFDEQNKVEAKTIELQNELAQETTKTALTLKEQLTILTDNVSTRNLELKTIEDLKKAYPGFNAFLDKNNNLTEQGIAFLKAQIALEELLAQRKLIQQKITEGQIKGAQDLADEIEFQNSLFGKSVVFLQGLANGLGSAVTGSIRLGNAVEDENRELNVLNTLLDRNTQEYDAALAKIKPFTTTLEKQADAEKKASEAAKETTEVIDKQAVALQLRLKLLTQIQERLKQVQSAELSFTDDVLQRQNEILNLQNKLLGERADALKGSSEAIEEIAKLFFESIPNEQQILETTDAVFVFFNSVRSNLKGVLAEGSLGFTELLNIVKQTGELTDSQIKILQSLPEETKDSFIEFFNSYKLRIEEIRKITTGVVGVERLFGLSPNEIFTILQNVERQQSQLFQDRIENGLTEIEILEKSRDLIAESFGLNQALEKLDMKILLTKNQIEVSDETQRKILTERLNLYLQERNQLTNIVDTILEGVVRNNKFTESIENANKAFEKNETQILKNKKALEQTFDPQQLEKFFAEYGEGIDDILKVLVLDTGAFLQRFGEDGTRAIIRGVVAGLKEQGKLTRQEVERTIDIFEKAAIGIKIAFGGTGEIFTEQIEYLRSLLRGLPNELTPLQKGFQNIAEIAEQILAAFSDLSGRLQRIIQSNNQLLLDQLVQDEEAALRSIGEGSERALELREQTQKEFAEKRFNIEKQARLQELDFAIANALADSAGAIINALATIPPPASVIYAATLTALTGAQVQAIRNQRTNAAAQQFVGRQGGLISGGSHEQGGVPALLEGGEFIVSRNAVSRFGDTISDLNSASGGRRLAIDDSRLVQAIADQNMTSTPLKAYVLYNDIQSTEKLNKKITQLAKL